MFNLNKSTKHQTLSQKNSIALIVKLCSPSLNNGIQVTTFNFIQIIIVGKHFHQRTKFNDSYLSSYDPKINIGTQ